MNTNHPKFNNYGSTIAIILGVISLLSFFSNMNKNNEPNVEMLVLGIVVISKF